MQFHHVVCEEDQHGSVVRISLPPTAVRARPTDRADTSIPAEVISGSASIKGSYSGPDADSGIARLFLSTDPSLIRFTPFGTYTITFSYRVIVAASGGFQFGLF